MAHSDFDNAIKLMPSNAKFFHSKGLAYQDTHEYDKAIEMFKKALEVSNDHIPSLYHLGLMATESCCKQYWPNNDNHFLSVHTLFSSMRCA